MHSALNRAQAVFGFFTTVALCVAAVAALSVLLMPADAARADVELKNVQVIKGRPHYYSSRKEEYAQVRFDLDADLSPLFNWNTKQLFVYVFATYPSTENTTASVRSSESILWDTIIPAPESPYSFSALRDRYFPAAAAASKPKRGLSKKNTGANGNSGSNRDKTKGKDKDEAPGILRLRNQRPKYQIGDVSGKMAERPGVSLAVGWNVQPWVGALWWSPGSGTVPHTQGTVARSAVMDFPPLKGSKQTHSQPQAREA